MGMKLFITLLGKLEGISRLINNHCIQKHTTTNTLFTSVNINVCSQVCHFYQSVLGRAHFVLTPFPGGIAKTTLAIPSLFLIRILLTLCRLQYSAETSSQHVLQLRYATSR